MKSILIIIFCILTLFSGLICFCSCIISSRLSREEEKLWHDIKVAESKESTNEVN